MLGFIKKLFGGKVEEAAASVPYKVEAPEAPKVTSVVEQASEAVIKSVAKAPAKKTPKKQAESKKSAGVKKSPRKPKSKA